ncbi:hypothetical protein, partial [Streptococcus pneumoniae]|uniref:hypothetical protein n=1 Tax=Streptococcus pneumoniae TaxID=1313 RepID=UPI0012D7C1EF
MAEFLHVSFAVFTGNQGEVRLKQLADQAEESRQQMAEITDKVHSEFLAKYKQQIANLDDADLAREKAKLQMQQREQA